MSNKVIGFTLNEKMHLDDYFIEQGVYNGFNKILDLGTMRCIRRKPNGFSSKELGELFIEIGNKLKTVGRNITDIKGTFVLRESIHAMGKQLILEMDYRELENEQIN